METTHNFNGFGKTLATWLLFVLTLCAIVGLAMQQSRTTTAEPQAWAADSTWKGGWE